MTDHRLSAPAALRNRDAILAVLAAHVPEIGCVLEIASGTGEHVSHFAAALPGLVFQPSDPQAERRASIDAWSDGLANLRPALDIDVTLPWPAVPVSVDVVLCCNMIHIAPWAATLGLLDGAASVLRSGGLLMLYGPFQRGGVHSAPSNAAFDADLRGRNAEWGVRDIDIVSTEASGRGFDAPVVVEMPANNLSVLFWKR